MSTYSFHKVTTEEVDNFFSDSRQLKCGRLYSHMSFYFIPMSHSAVVMLVLK